MYRHDMKAAMRLPTPFWSLKGFCNCAESRLLHGLLLDAYNLAEIRRKSRILVGNLATGSASVLQMKSGDLVRFVGDLESLLANLPAEEVEAISEGLTRQPFRVAALTADGPIEIELSLGAETHFFYVSAAELQPIE